MFADALMVLAEQGVLAGTGCGAGRLCVSEPILRWEMAVWTVRVLDGQDPPAISRTRFNDVDAASFHAPFIERMAELGVTRGCGDGSGFCPDRTVTRAQMARSCRGPTTSRTAPTRASATLPPTPGTRRMSRGSPRRA